MRFQRQEDIDKILEGLSIATADLGQIRKEPLGLVKILSAFTAIIKDIVFDEIIDDLVREYGREEYISVSRERRSGLLFEVAGKKLCRKLDDPSMIELIEYAEDRLVLHDRKAIPVSVKLLLLARSYRCEFPGCEESTELEIDHIKPVKRGGSSQLFNLRWLCRFHNRSKGSKSAKLEI